jgi:hypothetical protein
MATKTPRLQLVSSDGGAVSRKPRPAGGSGKVAAWGHVADGFERALSTPGLSEIDRASFLTKYGIICSLARRTPRTAGGDA